MNHPSPKPLSFSRTSTWSPFLRESSSSVRPLKSWSATRYSDSSGLIAVVWMKRCLVVLEDGDEEERGKGEKQKKKTQKCFMFECMTCSRLTRNMPTDCPSPHDGGCPDQHRDPFPPQCCGCVSHGRQPAATPATSRRASLPARTTRRNPTRGRDPPRRAPAVGRTPCE